MLLISHAFLTSSEREVHVPQCSEQQYSQELRNGSNPESTSREMDKDVCIYTQWSITQTGKRLKKMLFAATWMDLETVILSEVSQTEQDKCHMLSLIGGI